MDAEGGRPDANRAAADTACTRRDDGHRLGRSVCRGSDQGPGLGSGNKMAAGVVATVGERFGCHPQPFCGGDLGQPAAGGGEEQQLRPVDRQPAGDGGGQGLNMTNLMVERAVQLDVPERISGYGRKLSELAGNEVSGGSRADGQRPPAEAGRVGVARMAADRHTVAAGQGDRFSYRLAVACMGPAGDVRRTDQRHHGGVVAGPFAEVTVEIDGRAVAHGVGFSAERN